MTLPRDEVTWFEQVAPGLLRNKALRNYFSQYTAAEWPEVTKLTLLYGILNLHKLQPGRPFSLAQLRDLLAKGQIAATVETALPDVSNQLDKLQGQLEDITGELYHPSAKAPGDRDQSALQPAREHSTLVIAKDHSPQRLFDHVTAAPAAAVPAVIARQSHPLPAAARGRRLSGPVLAPMAPAGWRTGGDLRTWSPPGKKRSPGRARSPDGVPAPGSAVYPSWWGDGSDDPPPPPAPVPAERTARPPPRMAYSVQPEPAPIYQDDLVTSRHLSVPSSGYGQQAVNPGPPPTGPGAEPGHQHAHHPFAADAWAQPVTLQPQQLQPPQQQQQQQQAQQVLYALHPSGVMMPVVLNPHQAQAQGQAQSDKRIVKKPNLSAVESRIKAQVASDRALARQRNQARQQAISNVFKTVGSVPPLRDTLLNPLPRLPSPAPLEPAAHPHRATHNTPGSSASAAHPHHLFQPPRSAPHASPSTPSEAADSLANSRWASWFMGDAPHSPHPDTLGQPISSPAAVTPYQAAPAGTAPAAPLSNPNSVQQASSQPVVTPAGLLYPFIVQAPDAGMGGAQSWPAGGLDAQHMPVASAPATTGWPAVPAMQQAAPVSTSGNALSHEGSVSGVVAGPGGLVPGAGQRAAVLAPGPVHYPAGLKWDLDDMTLQNMMATHKQDQGGKQGESGAAAPRFPSGVRQEVARWSKTWVGDYGHMDREPRFDFSKPFQLQEGEQNEAVAEGSEPVSFRAEVEELKARMAQARLDGLAAAAEDVSLGEAQARLDAALAAIHARPTPPKQEAAVGAAGERHDAERQVQEDKYATLTEERPAAAQAAGANSESAGTNLSPSLSLGSYSPAGASVGGMLASGAGDVKGVQRTLDMGGVALSISSLTSLTTEQLLRRSLEPGSIGEASDAMWLEDAGSSVLETLSSDVGRLYQSQFG